MLLGSFIHVSYVKVIVVLLLAKMNFRITANSSNILYKPSLCRLNPYLHVIAKSNSYSLVIARM